MENTNHSRHFLLALAISKKGKLKEAWYCYVLNTGSKSKFLTSTYIKQVFEAQKCVAYLR